MKTKLRTLFIFGILVTFEVVYAVAQASAQTENAKPAASPTPATIRVGFVTPKVQMAQSANDAAEAVRNTLVADLKGSKIQIVPLDARLPDLIEAEAKEKDCAYVLYTSLTLKKGSSGGGGMFARIVSQATSSATSRIPSGNVAATTVRTETTDAINKAVVGIKAHDELSLEYKLFAAGVAAPRLTETVKAKARQDGEDILSPLVEKATTVILKELTKK